MRCRTFFGSYGEPVTVKHFFLNLRLFPRVVFQNVLHLGGEVMKIIAILRRYRQAHSQRGGGGVIFPWP